MRPHAWHPSIWNMHIKATQTDLVSRNWITDVSSTTNSDIPPCPSGPGDLHICQHRSATLLLGGWWANSLPPLCQESGKLSINCVPNGQIHPGRLTWNLQITHLERKMIFQTSMILFNVNLPGCMAKFAKFIRDVFLILSKFFTERKSS